MAVHRRVGLRVARAPALTGDPGTAIIEFVFVAVVAMIPLVYLLTAVAVVQRNQLAVADAAREVGRAVATAGWAGDVGTRVEAAARLALAAHGLPDDATVRFVAADAPCSSDAIAPGVQPGATFTVCVLRRAVIPAVPRLIAGRGIESVGRYTVHIDDFRTVR